MSRAASALLKPSQHGPPVLARTRESRDAVPAPSWSGLASPLSLQRAFLTLCAIRQRYQAGHDAYPDARCYTVHVVIGDGDLAWISAAIEAVEQAIARGACEADGSIL